MLSGLALAAATLLVFAGKRAGVVARAASVLAPLSLFWMWALPYLPWLPDRIPLLLVLAGPIRWGVAGVAAVGTFLRVGTLGSFSNLTTRLDRRKVFAITLVAHLALGLYAVRVNGLGGDEPHYLIVTESLLRDGDLKIENNHLRGDYRSFFHGELRPDYMQRGKDGEIYSIHSPGLPALLLPVYALAGYLGAVSMLCGIGALAALAIFDMADRVAGRRAAVVTWAGVCFTVPFVPHSWLIFPEMPGALIVAWAALWVWQSTEARTVTWIWRGAALGALPWLHTKFVVLLGILATALAFRLLSRSRALIALAMPIALSGGLWLYSFYALYGVLDPEAPYGAYTRIYVLTRNIPHGLVGLFFDQKFGLLFYSPVYLASVAGAWLMVRRRETRYVGTVLLLVTGAFVASTARLYMFWGGSSAPARFLVPILPCLAPMIAVAIARARSAAARAVIGLWLGIGLAIAVAGVGWPARLMLFSDPHGRARVLEALQAGSPLARVIPTFTDPDWLAQVNQLGPWLIAGTIGLAVLAVAGHRWSSLGSLRLAGIAAGAFALSGAVLVARPAADIREDTARRGVTDLLWRHDGTRLRALDYVALQRATPDHLRQLSTLVLQPRPDDPARGGYATAPVTLPPGSYEAVVSFASSGLRDGEVLVAAPPQAVFGRASGTLPNPTRVRFELPVTARRLSVRIPDAAIGSSVRSIEVVPLVLVPPQERENAPVRTIESLTGPRTGHLVYTDEHAYPEGGVFWTRGTEETTILVAPQGAARIVLTLFTGPNNGEVTVSAAGKVRTIPVLAGATAEVAIEVPAGRRLVPLAIRSQTVFRPAEVEKTSTDTRRLGCQVRVGLE
jgi:hypothetical protein